MPGLYCLKKQSWKNGHFWTKTMGQPLWKNVNFSTFSTSCCYSLERRFFVLQYRKRHLPGLYCMKKQSWKNGHFWTKTMGSPRWKKCQFFAFFNFLFLYPKKAFFRCRISWKTFPRPASKKKLQKWPFFDENHGFFSP